MGDVTSQVSPASFSDALRQAIKNRGVSLEYLRGRLSDLGTPLSVATLSYWRSGRSQPEHQTSLDALASLEEILLLPEGHLRSRLLPSRRPGPRGGRMSLADVMGGDAVRDTLVQLGFDPDASEALVETSTQVTVELDAEGRARSSVSRSVWKAVRDDASGTPIVLRVDGAGSTVPEFVARKGCTLGKTHMDVGAGVYGVELLLERPLHTGETAITELEIQIPHDAVADPFFELLPHAAPLRGDALGALRRRQGPRALRGVPRGSAAPRHPGPRHDGHHLGPPRRPQRRPGAARHSLGLVDRAPPAARPTGKGCHHSARRLAEPDGAAR